MAWAATGTPAWPQPDVKELFPLMLRQQKDPTWRSLAITMGTLNAGLVLGWAVRVWSCSSPTPLPPDTRVTQQLDQADLVGAHVTGGSGH